VLICLTMSLTYGLYASQADRSSCRPSLKCVCCCWSRLRIMPPAVTFLKSVRGLPDEVDGLHPAAKGGGKRKGGGRFLSRRLTKTLEQRTKAVETAAREELRRKMLRRVSKNRPRSSRLSGLSWNASARRTKIWRSKVSLCKSNSSRRGNGLVVRRSASRS
jgi:hypothetical protein